MNRIKIKNSQKKIKINQKKIRNLAAKILKSERISDYEISILFVCDKDIRKLNRVYLKNDYPTDVLAFRMNEGKYVKFNPYLLGDVVISVDTAKRRAQEIGTTLIFEINLYLVHGILHLLGYDDNQAKNRNKMYHKQFSLLEKYA